jgi:hypothetical protein
MGYRLEAIVARADLLHRVVVDLRHAHVAPLEQGFALVPVTESLADEAIDAARGSGRSGRLPERSYMYVGYVAAQLCEWSRHGPVGYVEADYFGGTGDQGACGWNGGDLAFEPLRQDRLPSPISQLLRWLGVQQGDAHDEFEAVGLDRHRDTRDWLPA